MLGPAQLLLIALAVVAIAWAVGSRRGIVSRIAEMSADDVMTLAIGSIMAAGTVGLLMSVLGPIIIAAAILMVIIAVMVGLVVS